MPEKTQDEHAEGLNLGDIYYVLFRRKWIILFFSAAGVLAALTLLFLVKPPLYESEAKLFIRYVVEGKSLNPPGTDSPMIPLNAQEGSIINTEIEILKSLDLAQQVVADVGAERILAKAGGGTNRDRAAALVLSKLDVYPPARGSVIPIFFQHPDPQVAQEVLGKIIVVYFKKHAEMHQPVGIFGDFLTQETKRLRSELAQTEQQLREAKSKAGVTSLEDAKKANTEQISKIRESLFNAEAELAEHQAAFAEVAKLTPSVQEATNNAETPAPVELVNEYRRVTARLDRLLTREQELLTQFTENSALVVEIREQIAEAESSKKKLEENCPSLAGTVVSSPKLAGQLTVAQVDTSVELVQVRALKSKVEVLKSQLAQIQAEIARISEMEATIQELQRKKDLEEADLKYFAANMEQTRIDEALGSGKAPNIGIIQSPSPPQKKWSKPFKKKVMLVAAGGIACGLALAFLIELLFDRTVKRPVEIETKLRLPLLISIPHIGGNGSLRHAIATGREPLLLKDAKAGAQSQASQASQKKLEEAGGKDIAAWERKHPLRRFFEGLRNRLIVHFEVKNLNHKPKLVAVTSCGRGAGVSSIAAGLAASLSETGDGNVLLVDMNFEEGAAHQFYKGKLSCGLEDALGSEPMKSALVQTNLYVVAEWPDNGKLPQVLPKRFATLVPKFKSSHYDYIIFDMPPVSQTSVTPRLAGFMDMVLLVIESEKTNQDIVKRANALLAESKANVSTVLNKARTYVPKCLHQEFLDDA
jgi:uncharacterized protein involved in exopolysaccharide biosynthesis/Mrp family chromosome partitioning ATPase